MCFLFGVVLTSMGLFACSWPWPSVTEDTTGLGNSEIAGILKRSCCVVNEMVVQNIRTVLEKAKVGRSLRSAAESVGFTCEESPSKTCRYVGMMTYQVHGAPKENVDAQKVHIISYSIVLPTYDNTNDIQVDQKTTIAP
jgi:hypothetical protein